MTEDRANELLNEIAGTDELCKYCPSAKVGQCNYEDSHCDEAKSNYLRIVETKEGYLGETNTF